MDGISFTRSIPPSAVVSAGGASLGRGGSARGMRLRLAEARHAGEATGGTGVAAERRQGRTEQISNRRHLVTLDAS